MSSSYDPDDPVPTYGGNVSMYPSTGGPRDQRAIQRRDDVLVYTGELLEKEIEVTGRVLTMLHAASSATDTDFTAKLVDVHPNGYAQLLAEGIIRAAIGTRSRSRPCWNRARSTNTPSTCGPSATSSSAGTGFNWRSPAATSRSTTAIPTPGTSSVEDAELRKATQTVHHDADYPSHIVLPVIP